MSYWWYLNQRHVRVQSCQKGRGDVCRPDKKRKSLLTKVDKAFFTAREPKSKCAYAQICCSAGPARPIQAPLQWTQSLAAMLYAGPVPPCPTLPRPVSPCPTLSHIAPHYNPLCPTLPRPALTLPQPVPPCPTHPALSHPAPSWPACPGKGSQWLCFVCPRGCKGRRGYKQMAFSQLNCPLFKVYPSIEAYTMRAARTEVHQKTARLLGVVFEWCGSRQKIEFMNSW